MSFAQGHPSVAVPRQDSMSPYTLTMGQSPHCPKLLHFLLPFNGRRTSQSVTHHTRVPDTTPIRFSDAPIVHLSASIPQSANQHLLFAKSQLVSDRPHHWDTYTVRLGCLHSITNQCSNARHTVLAYISIRAGPPFSPLLKKTHFCLMVSRKAKETSEKSP